MAGTQPDFHYADDIALVAETLSDLKALLNRTAEVLAARRLLLGVPKCVGLVLGVLPTSREPPPLIVPCLLVINGSLWLLC